MNKYLFLLLPAVLLGAGCSTSSTTQTQSPIPPVKEAPVVRSTSTELNMSGKGLTSIPMDVFSRTDLVKLDLSNNQLTGAPPSQIGQLKNLTSLDLSHNSLTGLSAEIGQLNKLETLDVSNNKLTGLPMELGNLTQLKVLDITGNNYSKQDLDQIAAKLTKTVIRR